jgi:choline-glycine betaine transporter
MQEDRTDPRLRLDLLGGRISCAVGVLCGIAEVLAALLGAGANISAGALGVGLGVLGYFLGARRLAVAPVFICVAAILFGLAASQGLIPGIPPSNHAFPTNF